MKIQVCNYKGALVFHYDALQVPEVGDTFTFPVWSVGPKKPVEGVAIPAEVVGREWVIHINDEGFGGDLSFVKLTLKAPASIAGDM